MIQSSSSSKDLTIVSVHNEHVQLQCSLDTSYKALGSLDKQLGRKLEWSISPYIIPSSSSALSSSSSIKPYFISRDEVFYLIKGRTRTIEVDNSKGSSSSSTSAKKSSNQDKVLSEQKWEYPLLYCSKVTLSTQMLRTHTSSVHSNGDGGHSWWQFNSTVDKDTYTSPIEHIVIDTQDYPDDCPIESAKIIITVGNKDENSRSMMFMKACVKFKERTESLSTNTYMITKDCIDSIHHFRGEIDYDAFTGFNDNKDNDKSVYTSRSKSVSSNFKFRSAPADKASYEYIRSKAIYGTRDAAISLSSKAWVTFSRLFGDRRKDHHAVHTSLRREQETKQNRVFFCNGWNAWSFSGAVRQGHTLPLYNMPAVFVKNFHNGDRLIQTK